MFRNYLLLFALVSMVAAQIIECPEGDCNQKHSISPHPGSQEQISKVVDIEIRRQFWYYIRKSDTIYAAQIDTGKEYLFFNVYQNKIGTFLSIAAYNFENQKTDVRTMIRLGEGISSKTQQKIKVDPFFMEITVQNQKYIVQLDQRGLFFINDQAYQTGGGSYQAPKQMQQQEQISDEDVEQIDKFIRNEYWFYIQRAERLKFQKINLKSLKYCLITYNHQSGAYLAVANMSNENRQIKINTFVRLGEQQEKQQTFSGYQDFGIMTIDSFGIVPITIA